MPYTALSVATLSKLVEDYTKLKALTKAAKVSPSAKVKLDKQIERVSQSAVKSVAVLMKAANREFDSHEVTAKRLLAEAEALLKNTKAAAEAYRKDPTATANVEFVNNFVKDLADRRDSYATDAADFAQAYSAVRAFNAGTLPPAAAEELNTARAALSSKQRATIVIGSQLAAAVKQAEAQRAIVAKAGMKQAMKGGAAQRSITVAREKAAEVAAELATALEEQRSPAKPTLRPDELYNYAERLRINAVDKSYPPSKYALAAARDDWSLVEQSHKAMLLKAASMEKVLAVRTRSFRKNELADKGVQAQLTKAGASLKEAKRVIKTYTPHFETAKKSAALIEANAKKLKLA